MSEVRIRPRQVLILIIVFLVALMMVRRNGKRACKGPEYLQAMFIQGDTLPTIYAVTPTYPRLAGQKPGLEKRSTLLNIKTPSEFKLKGKDPNWIKPRGVEQRNLALSWLRSHVDVDRHSIVFFMNDDNSYSTELFAEMSKIERGRVGVWPLGLVGSLTVERPLLTEDGTKVTGFNAAWRPERPFPIDMAAFAISMDLFIRNPQATFSYEVQRGYQSIGVQI